MYDDEESKRSAPRAIQTTAEHLKYNGKKETISGMPTCID